ncbi:MAG: hypothetical protein LBU44_07355, partial [Mediterranea sp.]|nr:hypothetical protein [Mediterranea sp.]
YDPAQNTYTNTKNTNNKSNLVDGHFVFMDRNLGATEAGLTAAARGLIYQWGRKDPFPATDAVTTGSWSKVETTSALGTVTNTIKNPGVYYYGVSGSDYDWHYAKRDNTLWGHDANGGIKTIYDPCPSGWRVPVNYNISDTTSPWYGMTSTSGFSNGYNWGTNAVYPAAGFRISSSGSLGTVGAGGNYWSASPGSSSSLHASLLYFTSGYVNVYRSDARAYGFSVRCVQE